MNEEQYGKVASKDGFVAALDQSGGSTPKALAGYGISESAFSNDDEMFDLIHEMRSRIITSPAFTGEKVLGAILFEQTMDRDINGAPTPDFLWQEKQVVPFLKVDKGLADEANAAQVMNPMPGLDELLARAAEKRVFGTKMRSVIKMANINGIKAVVDQQFEVAHQILDAGLMPIIEPEVDIHSPEKLQAEAMLREAIMDHLDPMTDKQVMLKLSIPSEDNFYTDLINHKRVLRVVALSGGYARDDANERLSRNNGMIASFSRALAEGLSAQQSDEEFNAMLASTIDGIYQASRT